jgi:Uma2 family endonuclease
MVVPLGIRPRVTYEELVLICEVNDFLTFEWDPDGTLYIMAPAGAGPSRKNAELTFKLGVWAEADGTGVLFDSSGGFRLRDGKMRSPDAAWVPRSRWESLPKDERERGFPKLVPDFVAELRSPSDKNEKLREKMEIYRSNGVRLGWLIDPVDRSVEVYRPGHEVERLEKPTTLSGEDVLPGLVLDLKGILFE